MRTTVFLILSLVAFLAVAPLAVASDAPTGHRAVPFGTLPSGAAARAITSAGPELVVTGVEVLDNGDHDGWADTYEIVVLRISLYNRSAGELTDLVAHLATTAPAVSCLSDAEIQIASIPAGATVAPADGFVFQVGPVQRVDAFEELTATFELTIDGPGLAEPVVGELVIDLDLDAAGGGSPTAWFEGFEGTGEFGAFTASELDTGRNDLASSDGFRCQYSDPDWANSNSYGEVTAAECFLGTNPSQAAAFHWGLDGPPFGRSFSGVRSLHMGVPLAGGLGWTTPTASLEAVHTSAPIDLAYGRFCSVTGGTPCEGDLDCPAGESCVSAAPELSIKHQVSIVDDRLQSDPGESADRAVVQVQLADAAGQAVGPWFTVEPWMNVYDVQATDAFVNCMFDPIDDGTTEDDFFAPADPARRLGPSSTCYPAAVFAWLGDTDDPFDPANVGRASDGPGLEGATGPGTWVESRFRLDRWRGRRVRVRFLTTSIKANFYADTYEAVFHFNPDPRDDGWWIDDVSVADTLTAPATLVPDTKDNTALLVDGDVDGWTDTCDCAPGDGDTWAPPGEVGSLALAHDPGAGMTTLAWEAPLAPGGAQLDYRVVRSVDASFGSVTCMEPDAPGTTTASDPGTPPVGAPWFYLVGAMNSCGEGPVGSMSPIVPACD